MFPLLEIPSVKWTERFLVAFSFSTDTDIDLDCRGWQKGTSHQSTRHSCQDVRDSLSSMESGFSVQESKLRYFNLSYQTCIITGFFLFLNDNVIHIQLF